MRIFDAEQLRLLYTGVDADIQRVNLGLINLL